MPLPKISVVLRIDRQREGKSQIAIQVRFKNQRRQEFTGLYVSDEDFKDGIVSGTNANWYNIKIKKKIAELEAQYLRSELNDQPIRLGHKVSARRSFIQYATDFYNNRPRCSPDYKTRAIACIEKFEAFAGNVSFEQLTPQLMKDFEGSMHGLSRNTTNRVFKRIKQPVKMAIREELLSKDPFFIYTPPTYQQPDVDYLTMEEVARIQEAELSSTLSNIRAYFLLSCHTGLRYSDAAAFRKDKHIITLQGVKRLILTTQKTKDVVSIKLSPKVEAIIAGITGPLPSNVHCNRCMVDIVGNTEIGRHIHWHVSRHTFGVNCASLGIPIEATAKLMGHKSIRTTQIYYKIVDVKSDEYMDRWG